MTDSDRNPYDDDELDGQPADAAPEPADDADNPFADQDGDDLPPWPPPAYHPPLDDEALNPPAESTTDTGDAAAKAGKARERQLKRQQQPMVQKKPVKPQQRQTRPSERIRLPKVTLPKINRSVLYVVGAVALVIVVVVFLGRLRNNPVEARPNGIWLGTEWTYDKPTDEQVAALAERLKSHQIGSVYAWVSWLQPDGTWRGSASMPDVQTFVSQFRSAYPEATLYGWVSVPVEGDGIPYRLDDPATRQKIVQFSQQVVSQYGFDGIFLNAEPVWNNDENFLALLRELRAALGQDVPISAAIPPDWSPLDANVPVPPQIVPGTVWDKSYKQSVSLLLDEMALMAYNSGLGAPSDYRAWVAYQVQTYAEALSELGEGTDLMIGIPTYDAALPGHDPYVENVLTAAEGVRQGMQAAGDAAEFVRGLALYADWTTTDDEWQAFMDAWARS